MKAWLPRGRMGRLRFFVNCVGFYILFIIATSALGFVETRSALLVGAIDLALFAAYAFFPLVGLYWLFRSGTPGINRWGARPEPNTTSTKVIAVIVPGVFFALVIVGITVAGGMAGYEAARSRNETPAR